jgi:putative endonuclease
VASSSQRLARLGEEAASRHYLSRGYRLLARNWRCPRGELDLVLTDGSTLVFCEVKTRGSAAAGFPEESVTVQKQSKLRELAVRFLMAEPGRSFLAGRGGQNVDIRFDVASVTLDSTGRPVVDLIEDAF